MEVKIKVKADLEKALGKLLAKNLLTAAKSGHRKRLPSHVSFASTKPQFLLSDGDVLHAYGADLSTGEIVGHKFCGSGESILNHFTEQQGEGHSAPKDKALIFVHSYWNGRNHSWSVTVVSDNVTTQLGKLDSVQL